MWQHQQPSEEIGGAKASSWFFLKQRKSLALDRFWFSSCREHQMDFKPNALASKAFGLQQSVKSIAYPGAAYFGNVGKKVTETAAGPLGKKSINVRKTIDEGPQFRLICHETSAGHKYLKLMSGQAKIVKGAIDFYSRFHRSAPYKMKGLMRMIRVLTVQPEPAIRFQDTEYFRERPGFVLHPVKNAIQINDFETCVSKLG
jgi:hypothetical protein